LKGNGKELAIQFLRNTVSETEYGENGSYDDANDIYDWHCYRRVVDTKLYDLKN
jgi:hypothetical protein